MKIVKFGLGFGSKGRGIYFSDTKQSLKPDAMVACCLKITFLARMDDRRQRIFPKPEPLCSRCFPSVQFEQSGSHKEGSLS